MKRLYYIQGKGEPIPVEVEGGEGEKVCLRFPGRNSHYELILIRPGVALLAREDGRVKELLYRVEAGKLQIFLDQEEYLLEVMDELERARRARSGSVQGEGILKALMPGRVVEVRVREGERVEAQQGVLIISAMKMENELKAPIAGIVRKVYVNQGDVVEAGALLLEIASEGA